ncbi:MAG: tol-pal system YbgF family protein [Planctomycetaceae bacterium]
MTQVFRVPVLGLVTAGLFVGVVDGQRRRPGRKRPVRRRFGRRPVKRPGRTIRVPAKRSPTDTLRRKRDDERKAALKTLNRDLVYWKRVLAKPPVADAPGSPGAERERALFLVGVLSMKTRRWKPAATAFAALVKRFPKGPWSMSARCRLIDLKLEREIDLEAAEAELKIAMLWAATKHEKYFPRKRRPKKDAKTRKPASGGRKPADGSKKKTTASSSNNPGADAARLATRNKQTRSTINHRPSTKKPPSFTLKVPTEKQSLAAVYRRAGILSYVRGKRATPKGYLLRARVLTGRPAGRPSPDDIAEARLLAALMSRRFFTPLSLWTSRKAMFPYLLYGDLLYETRDFERARDFAAALLTHKTLKFTTFQQSYLHYLRGRGANGLRDVKQRRAAAADFLAAHKKAPKSRWADDALFLAANARWNHERNAEKAVALWRQLLKEHPKSVEADRSAYYIGVVYQQTKRWSDAKSAYESLLKDRPKSPFAKLTKKQLKQVNHELLRARR